MKIKEKEENKICTKASFSLSSSPEDSDFNSSDLPLSPFLRALSFSIYKPHKCWAEVPGKIFGFQCRPNRVHCQDNHGGVTTLEHPSLSSGFVVALS